MIDGKEEEQDLTNGNNNAEMVTVSDLLESVLTVVKNMNNEHAHTLRSQSQTDHAGVVERKATRHEIALTSQRRAASRRLRTPSRSSES